jgi:hypothetical protein
VPFTSCNRQLAVILRVIPSRSSWKKSEIH